MTQHRIDRLEAIVERLEAENKKLTRALADNIAHRIKGVLNNEKQMAG